MARSYSERIENMDNEAREELDSRIREYEKKNGWQRTLAKFKPSPIQLRAIVAGKDARKAKAKAKRKVKKLSKKATKATKATKKTAKKAAKKATKAKKKTTKKAAKKVANSAKAAKKATKKKAGRPKKANGVTTKVNAKGDLIIEGKVDATKFVQMILTHSERLATALRA